MKKYLLIFVIINSILTFSQKNDFGSWNILNLKYNINEKWSLNAEGQIRSLKFYSNFHYYEFKSFINYNTKNIKLALGAGSYQTYKEGGDFLLPKNNNEFRIWPQLILFQNIGFINIEQRCRAELRFTSKGYRNRFRYRLGINYPFGKGKNSFKPFQVAFNNELFFTDSEPYFERNRVSLTFNFKPSKNITLQLGHVHQFDYKINDEIGRDFLVLGFYYEISRKKDVKESNQIDLNEN